MDILVYGDIVILKKILKKKQKKYLKSKLLRKGNGK